MDATPDLVRSILAPILQPGANLQQTQAQIPLTQQEQATSAQSAATSSQEQANLAIQNQSLQSEAAINKLKQQQAYASVNLGKDLQSGMTWDQARQKYTPLGLSADDVFKQYLSNNKYGTPHESPDTLISQGVKPETLGTIGQPGSFNDKYNTKNAINEIRTAQGLWNKITPNDILQQKVFGKNENVNNYLSYKTTLGNHLQSLIPGASGAQATGQQLLGQLPDPTNIANFGGNVAKGAFNTLENSLLTQKGYSQKELGIGKNNTGSSNTGGELLNNILDTVKNSQQYAGVSGFNTAMSTLGPLGGILGVGKAGATAAAANAPEAAAKEVAAEPGALTKLIQPGKAKAAIGSIRDAVVKMGDDAGNTIKGEDLAQQIRSWADNAKLGNLSNGKQIEEAAQTAEDLYKGKTFKPSDLKNIYDQIENGFTKGGAPRSSAEAYVDRGTQKVLANTLDNIAPGFKKANTMFSKVYNTEKSPVGKVIKNLPYNAGKAVLNAGANAAGFGILKDILNL